VPDLWPDWGWPVVGSPLCAPGKEHVGQWWPVVLTCKDRQHADKAAVPPDAAQSGGSIKC
jgi:hypothetical protein